MASADPMSVISGMATMATGRRSWRLIAALVFCLGIGEDRGVIGSDEKPAAAAAQSKEPADFDADRAYADLVKVCEIGPRISGTEGMDQQQQLLAEHFSKLGAKVQFQSFDARHPVSGGAVRMNNMIISWHPEAAQRVLLCCHYDTRPLPDRDSDPNLASRGRFLGANDGASGVALLMEMGRHLPTLETTYGVDFVFFDGEELVYGEKDEYFLGSTHFARDYRARPPEHKYLFGVLVDMIGDKQLQLYQEINSLKYAQQLTHSIWKTAKRLGIKEFVAKRKHEVRDDHLPLNKIAKIPTCDLIDFDYPHWHTTRDVPSACSGASLAKVGRVLLAWLQEVPEPARKK
ncbi:MAG: M28 family peptidase [Planctomycetales bacterium]